MEHAQTLAYMVVDFDPTIFHIWGPIAVRWYGVAYVAGFLVAFFLWRRAVSKGLTRLTHDNVEELLSWGIAGVLVGGRVGYIVMYDWGSFVADPIMIFKVYDGGMSFHGGALGGVAAVFIVSLRRRLSPLEVGDLGVMGVPWGLMFGRIANFVNGELWGKISTVSWAMVFPRASYVEAEPTVSADTVLGAINANPRHPSQLYEALLEGLLIGLIMLLLFWKTRIRSYLPGVISGLFILLYAIMRIVCEVFREPDVGVSLIFGLSRGTFYSLMMAVLGIGLIAFSVSRAMGRRKESHS